MHGITLHHIADALRTHTPVPLPHHGNRKACVMVTLVNTNGRLHLLLTKRADSVEHHKGQISFPGGMVDDSDEDHHATALRELEEEVGVTAAQIRILGVLDDIHIPTGFIVTPVVGYIDCLPELRTNASEVAEVLLIPLEHFFDPALHRTETRVLMGTPRTIDVYDVWKEPVWGATAHIIKQLTMLLSSTSNNRDV
jgi:8-oxo-dGTP pyrophosphatase MutT (NUDIX family)